MKPHPLLKPKFSVFLFLRKLLFIVQAFGDLCFGRLGFLSWLLKNNSKIYQRKNFFCGCFFILKLRPAFRNGQLKNTLCIHPVFEFQCDSLFFFIREKYAFFHLPHYRNGRFHFVHILSARSGRSGSFVQQFFGEVFHFLKKEDRTKIKEKLSDNNNP